MAFHNPDCFGCGLTEITPSDRLRRMKQLSGLLSGILFIHLPLPTFALPIPEEVAEELLHISKKDLNELFDVRNHKGERVFRKKNDPEPGIWATRDPNKDQLEGTSTDLLYRKFRIPKSGAPVIVAVIDSGVDISHPELREKLWTNETELYGKPGVDDDGDGYIDDVYGWNFIGNRDGRNLKESNLELARVYSGLKRKESEGVLSATEIKLLRKTSSELQSKIESATKAQIKFEAYAAAIEFLKRKGMKAETLAALDALDFSDPEIKTALILARDVFSRGLTSKAIADYLDYFRTSLKYHLNPAFDPSEVIGDDPGNMSEIGYGNPDVTGPDSLHGTHVAGIIAADRDNSFGIDGQARNVRIMSLRAVPDGDERDKDIANAIRFAVDHGAKIINMSFGKPYSPGKATVDQAVLYAESKGVILIHAAGNDHLNTEGDFFNYPNRDLTTLNTRASSWIEVGASGKKRDQFLAAEFSNFGKTSVDVFAPGVEIVSTAPGNRYATLDGTSMASPEVAGIAAILLSKVPKASAAQIRDAILSTVNHYPDLRCVLPGTARNIPTMVPFDSLSVSGGTVNALEALRWLLAN